MKVIVSNAHRFTHNGVEYSGGLNRKQAPGVVEMTADEISHHYDAGVRFEVVDGDETVELDALDAMLGGDVAALLRNAGYETPEAVRDAADDDLRAVSGIGEGRLARIREAVAGNQGPQGAV